MEGLLKHAATLLQHVVGSVVDSAPHAQVKPVSTDNESLTAAATKHGPMCSLIITSLMAHTIEVCQLLLCMHGSL